MKPFTVKTEVSGSVWKIEVQVGDAVEADQALVIIESMKMEIPASAPLAGVVQQILVREGEAATEGQALVVIGLR